MNRTSDSTRRLWLLVGAVVAAAVIVGVAIAISSSGGGSKRASTPRAAAAARGLFAGIPQSGATLGNPKARVTVLEFADLQCPFCRDYTLTTFPAVVDRYVRSGRVKMQFHNFPFLGPDSLIAARAAAAAEQRNRLWDFIEIWYHNQGEENSGYVKPAFISRIATAAGLNGPQLLREESSAGAKSILRADAALSKRYGVDSTPALIVIDSSGHAVTAPDYTQLEPAIQSALGG